MKKFISILLCGLLAASVVTGCSKKEDSSKNGNSVTLGEYKGIQYTPMDTTVTDEQVETQIQSLLDANPTITAVDRPAQNGDIVNIDYTGLKDGVAFDGGSATGTDLTLGSGRFIDGFEDGLIGASAGDEVSLNLTFPEDYSNEDLSGQAVVFEVKVNEVKESTPAVLNEEFVTSYTEYLSVDELRTATRTNLEEAAQSQAQSQKEYDVFMAIMDNSTVTVTDEAVQEYYDEMYTTYEQQAAAFGMDLETMVGYFGMTLEQFQEELKAEAKTATEQNAVIEAIAAAEGFTVTDEERQALADEFGYESVEAMIEDAGEHTVDLYILREKVLEFVTENAVAV